MITIDNLVKQLQADMLEVWSQIPFPGELSNEWMDWGQVKSLFNGKRFDEVNVLADGFDSSFPLNDMSPRHAIYYLGTYLKLMCEHWLDKDTDMRLPAGDIPISQSLMALSVLWDVEGYPQARQIILRFIALVNTVGCEDCYWAEFSEIFRVASGKSAE